MRRTLALVFDVAAILVFVAIGRTHHGHLVDLSGMASTSWPFLAGLGLGWSLSWRRPMSLAPAGVVVWLTTVAAGMLLRVLGGQGTALAFIAVALGFLGAELLGWRLVVRVLLRNTATTSNPSTAPSP